MSTTTAMFCTAPAPAAGTPDPKTRIATFLVFSGELDKHLMAFTLANGAAASGLSTTMFFTFWAVAALRRPARVRGKGLLDRAFGWMLPSGSRALPMSRMHMLGIGPRLIRWRMRKKGIASLETLIEAATALGVRLVVCETSMDLMGFRREEMIPGVEFGGVASCLQSAAGAEVAMVV